MAWAARRTSQFRTASAVLLPVGYPWSLQEKANATSERQWQTSAQWSYRHGTRGGQGARWGLACSCVAQMNCTVLWLTVLPFCSVLSLVVELKVISNKAIVLNLNKTTWLVIEHQWAIFSSQVNTASETSTESQNLKHLHGIWIIQTSVQQHSIKIPHLRDTGHFHFSCGLCHLNFPINISKFALQ